MDNAKTQLADKIKGANNILVTVSRNPSVDQLAACLGLALLLNKLDKHTAAVFSGQVPSTLEFLKPEETLEKNTDSLRDFIIALDKSKADKLRYKVEDDVVRIFITPYKTSISQADLEFSQGDFNVDLVIALGVGKQEDLDQAITAHGRILHDATVASITTSADAGLGTINWHDAQASSLSESVTDLGPMLGQNVLDNQIATALLTGIVAETDRFSNDKTSSQTMSASAALMAAGANQQLVASQLNESGAEPVADSRPVDKDTLAIDHDDEDDDDEQTPPQPGPGPSNVPELPPVDDDNLPGLTNGSKMITDPPSLGGMLNANTKVEPLEPSGDPLSLPAEDRPILNRSVAASPPLAPSLPSTHWPASPPPGMSHPTPDIPHAVIDSEPTPPPPPPPPSAPSTPAAPVDDSVHGTLTDLENSVHSPHLADVRDEVSRALNSVPSNAPQPPIQALNAQPLGDNLHAPVPMPPPPAIMPNPTPIPMPAQPGSDVPAPNADDVPSGNPLNANAPPPVPPPIPFQFGASGDGPSM